MPSTSFLERIPHDPDCVLGLVTDVERYPDFVPGMAALRITKRLDDGFEAEAVIAYKNIRETFGSRIKIDEVTRIVTVTKAERGGPVKELLNRWQFHELSDGTTLVDFQINVRLMFPLESLLKQKFDKVKTAVRDVFVQQALDNCPRVSPVMPRETLIAEVSDLKREFGHRLA